jgi:tetratricopeptide (TPR) repeat protein
MKHTDRPDESQVAEWLRRGIAAAKANQPVAARELLLRVIATNERNEQAWLWLSGVVESDEDRLICLENVLALDPDNVRARAGLRWLQERGVVAEPQHSEDASPRGAGPAEVTPARAAGGTFELSPQGCVYCGRLLDGTEISCPFCGGRLAVRHFRRTERSPLGYLLHIYWWMLGGINVADMLIITYLWAHLDRVSGLFEPYLLYLTGPVIVRDTTIGSPSATAVWVDAVRVVLLGLAVFCLIDGLGLIWRRPRAHTWGLALAALHLVLGAAFFVLGFLGYLLAAFRALFTVMVTVFMFNTVEDFSQVERRERLEPDRRLRNDVDYYARGREYEKRQMWAKALLHWRRAAALNPGRDTYYGAMARAYGQLGRYDEGLAAAEDAIRVSRVPQEWHRFSSAGAASTSALMMKMRAQPGRCFPPRMLSQAAPADRLGAGTTW